jgi:trwC relaxase
MGNIQFNSKINRSADTIYSYFSDDFKREDDLKTIIVGDFGRSATIDCCADKKTFKVLLNGVSPSDNSRLKKKKLNRAAFEMVFTLDKSVSIMAPYFKHTQIYEISAKSVIAVVKEIQENACVRIRKDGQNRRQNARNLCAMILFESLSRTGFAHLHTHVVIFNLTYDKKEKRIAALSLDLTKKQMQKYQLFF